MGKKVVMALARFNPPHLGHERLVSSVRKASFNRGWDHLVFTTARHDRTNPIDATTKLKHLARAFPDICFRIAFPKEGILEHLDYLRSQNYTDVVMMAGNDMASHYQQIFDVYNVLKVFNDMHVRIIGRRDPNSASLTEAASSTEMRALARNGHLLEFVKYCPTEIAAKSEYYHDMYEDVRAYGQ